MRKAALAGLLACSLAQAALLTLCTPVHAAGADCLLDKGSPDAAFVSVEWVDLLAKAGEPASKIAQMTLGDKACASTTATVNGETWVFVRTDMFFAKDQAPLQGWLPGEAVAYQARLTRHNHVRAQTVDVEVGDYAAEYKVKAGGDFEVWQPVSEHLCEEDEAPNEYGACEDVELVHGHFYGRGRLAIARSARLGDDDVFKLLDDGRLCPWQHGSPPASCR